MVRSEPLRLVAEQWRPDTKPNNFALTRIVQNMDWTIQNMDWTAQDMDWTAQDMDWTAQDMDWTIQNMDWTAPASHNQPL